MAFTRDLRAAMVGPVHARAYSLALGLLQVSERTLIGQIDTGLTRHPALGFGPGGAAPGNILIDRGRDFLAPDQPPFATPGRRESTIDCLRRGGRVLDCLTDYPDHGTKTLSVILSNNDELVGLAPGAPVIPVRIADGPIFQDNAQRDNMGPAMRHLLDLPVPPRVITISMGHPGHAGFVQPLISGLVADSGFPAETKAEFLRAWRMGVIVVAAAGQVITSVVLPARYKQVIAVGGYRVDGYTHYPDHNYINPGLVDIWAQADGINRALTYVENGAEVHSYARHEPDTDTDDVSGTSYAAPQVAAAAALWVETHFNALPAVGAPDAWKTVEAFRHALVTTAEERGLVLRATRRRVKRPCLVDVGHLLARAPVLPEGDGS